MSRNASASKAPASLPEAEPGATASTFGLAPDEFRVRSATVKPVTHELAEQFSTMPGSVSERPLDETRLNALTDRINKGWAVPFYWVTMDLPPDDKHPEARTIRINGRHSSTALANMNGSFPDGMLVNHVELEGGGEYAAPLAFRQFDAMLSARSRGDVSNAYMQVEEDLQQVHPRLGRVALEGIAWYLTSVLEDKGIEKGDDLYKFFRRREFHSFLLMLNGVVGNPKTHPEINKSAVWGAFYGMYLVDEDDAKEFIVAIVKTLPEERENGGSPEPAKALSAWLHSVIVSKETTNKDGTKLKPRQIYNGCVTAWRHYRDERPLPKGIKALDAKAAFLVLE